MLFWWLVMGFWFDDLNVQINNIWCAGSYDGKAFGDHCTTSIWFHIRFRPIQGKLSSYEATSVRCNEFIFLQEADLNKSNRYENIRSIKSVDASQVRWAYLCIYVMKHFDDIEFLLWYIKMCLEIVTQGLFLVYQNCDVLVTIFL